MKPFDHPRIYVLVLLLMITGAVYGNTFLNSWTYDDIPVVVENPDVQSVKGFMDNSYPGRPLRELTYIPEFKLFGTEPAGYHAQQLLWHGANGMLIFCLFAALGLEPLYAGLGSALFLVHPLQAESVASIAHRKELLALFFSLAAILAYIKAMRSAGRRQLVLICASLLGYGVALLANQTAVSLPLVAMLYEYLFLQGRERLLLKRPLLLALFLCIFGALALYHFRGFLSREQLLTVYTKNNFIESRSYLPLYLADLKAFGFYLYKIAVPVNLAPEYVIPISAKPFQGLALAGLGLLAAVAGAFVALRRTLPLAAFGIGWYLVMYLPVSNIVPVAYIVADRYMYLCLPGLALLVAALLRKVSMKWINAGFCTVLVMLAGLTIVQNGYWRDQHTLWRHAVKVNPESAAVQETVALSYQLTGDFITARQHARKAIELYKYDIHYYLTLAKIEDRLGNLAEALKNYEIFVAYGVVEYPREVAIVRDYLPVLRARIARLAGVPVSGIAR